MSRARTWFRRLLQNPLTTAALIFLLWKDATSWRHVPIPPARPPLMEKLFPSTLPLSVHHPPPFAYVLAEPHLTRVIDENSQSWSELAALTQTRPRDLARIRLFVSTESTGLWARTGQTATAEVPLFPMSNDGQFGGGPPDVARARGAFLDWCTTSTTPVWEHVAGHLRNGDITERTLLPWGYVHNALAATVLGAAVYSLGWVPRLVTLALTARARRRAARGLCVRCGYSLAGLRGGKCPECGEWQFTLGD